MYYLIRICIFGIPVQFWLRSGYGGMDGVIFEGMFGVPAVTCDIFVGTATFLQLILQMIFYFDDLHDGGVRSHENTTFSPITFCRKEIQPRLWSHCNQLKAH